MKSLVKLTCLCCAIFLCGIKLSFAQIDSAALKKLRNKYSWGSIYITYISFVNIKAILKDQKHLIPVEGKPFPPVTGKGTLIAGSASVSTKKTREYYAIAKLKGFIDQNNVVSINESVAFLQIDLMKLRAGFKAASDRTGTIQEIPWAEEEVFAVAEYCDEQINTAEECRRAIAYFNSPDAKLDSALSLMASVQKLPTISAEISFLLLQNFLELKEKRANEIPGLAVSRPETINQINDMQLQYMHLKVAYDKPSKNFVVAAGVAGSRNIYEFEDRSLKEMSDQKWLNEKWLASPASPLPSEFKISVDMLNQYLKPKN